MDCPHNHGGYDYAEEHKRYGIPDEGEDLATVYSEGVGACGCGWSYGGFNSCELAITSTIQKLNGKYDGLEMGRRGNVAPERLSDSVVYFLGCVSLRFLFDTYYSQTPIPRKEVQCHKWIVAAEGPSIELEIIFMREITPKWSLGSLRLF